MNGNDKAQSNRVDSANAWQKFSAEATKAAASGRTYDPNPPSNYYSNAGGRQNSNYNQPQQHYYQNDTSTSNHQNNISSTNHHNNTYTTTHQNNAYVNNHQNNYYTTSHQNDTYTTGHQNNTYTTSHQNNAYVNNYQNNTYTTNQSNAYAASNQDSTSTMNQQNDTYTANQQSNTYTTNYQDSTYTANYQDNSYTPNQSFVHSKVDNTVRTVNPESSEVVDPNQQTETPVKNDEHPIKDTIDFSRSPRPIETANPIDAIKPEEETNNEIKITANKDTEIKPEDDAQPVNVDKPTEETNVEEVHEEFKPIEEPEPIQNTTTLIENIAPFKNTTTFVEEIAPSEDAAPFTEEAKPAKDTTTFTEEVTPATNATTSTEETTPVEKNTSLVSNTTPAIEDHLPVDVSASLEEPTKVDEPSAEPATVDEPTPTEDPVSSVSDSESDNPENSVNTPSEEKYIAPKRHMNIVKDFGSMKYPEHITPPIGKSPETGRITYEPSFILAFRNLCTTTDADLSLITTTSENNRNNSRYQQQSNRSRYDSSRNNSRDSNKQWQHTGFHELERSGSKNRSGRTQKRNNNNKQEWWEVNQVTPLKKSENRWIPTVVATDGTASTASEVPAVSDLVPQDIIVRKVKSLLNKLTIEKFDSISTQIWEFAKQSEKEENGESFKNVIGLVFEKAIDEPNFASMWALLCNRMYELMGETGDSIKDVTLAQEENPAPVGAPLFRRYLLDICQQGFDKGWKFKVPKVEENEDVMMSDEYYEAVKAKRQGLGLVQFIGELYKLKILTDRVMIQCLIKLSPDPTKAEDDQTESICKLVTTIGKTMEDNQTYKEWLDSYFERMDVMYKSETLSSRVKFLIMDVFDLRKNNWVSQSSVQQTGPTTIAVIHEQIKKDNEEKEKEAAKRMNSPHSQYMSRQSSSGSNVSRQNSFGGNTRNNNRNTDFSNLGYARKILGSSNSSPLSGYDKKIAASDTSRFAAGATSMSNSYSALDGDDEQPTERKKLQLLPRQVPIEPETLEEDSEPELLSDEVIERKCKNIIDEYFSIREMPELCDCVEEELDHPHYRAIFARKLLDVVEKKDEDVDVVCEIIEILYEEQLLTRKEMVAAFKEFWEIYDDLIIDVPKAPEHVNRLLDASGIQRAEVALEQ